MSKEAKTPTIRRSFRAPSQFLGGGKPGLLELGALKFPSHWKEIPGFAGVSLSTNTNGQVIGRYLLFESRPSVLIGSREYSELEFTLKSGKREITILSRAAKIRTGTNLKFVLRKASFEDDFQALEKTLKDALTGTNDRFRAFLGLHKAQSKKIESLENSEAKLGEATSVAPSPVDPKFRSKPWSESIPDSGFEQMLKAFMQKVEQKIDHLQTGLEELQNPPAAESEFETQADQVHDDTTDGPDADPSH